MVGRVVSHYEIVEKIGQGGMGEVYKARDQKLNRFVAIKVLPAEHMQDTERRQRFLQEAQSASALNHPNIIIVHDVVAEGDCECLVMEYVTGRNLADIIPKGGLTSSQVLRYGIQIADALTAAHTAGILHRDLKPGNVMVNDKGLVKLLDFGLAKIMKPQLSGESDDATDTIDTGPKTTAGTILGTASYMSPEQIEGRVLDARSDIFSFGLILYEMITGSRAFQGTSAITTLTAVLRDHPRSFEELSVDAPPQLERLVSRCVEKDPAQRWQTMKDLHAALAGLKEDLDSGSIIASRRHAAIAAAAQKKSGTPVWAAGAGAAVLLLSGGLWMWSRSHAPATPAPSQPAAQAPLSPAPSETQTTPPAPEQAQQQAAALTKADSPKAQTPKPPRQAAITGADPQSAALSNAAPLAPEPSAPPPPAAPATPALVPVNVPDGTRLRLTLAADVPAGAKKGDLVPLTVAHGLKIGDAVVVAEGSSVSAVVGEAGRRFPLLRKKGLPLMLDTVAAVDGTRLRLRGKVDPGTSGKALPLETPDSKEQIALPRGFALDAFVDGGADVKAKKH